MKERVQKLMAQANIGSRRSCEELIQQGRVKVNGKVIHLGDQADPRTDVIEVDGNKLAFPEQKIYLAFNKPRNVLSTDEPHEGDNRRTVRDFLPFKNHLFSAGRLDADSEGLMVLTDDGDLANKLTHPRYRHTKTYKVVVSGLPTQAVLSVWQKGVTIEDEDSGESYQTAPCTVMIVDGGSRETTLRIIMTEGKKRQIRRVASLLGHPVKTLIRTHIGRLGLGTLRPGEWRELGAGDLAALKRMAEDAPEKPGRRKRTPRKVSEAPAEAQPRRSTRSSDDSSDKPRRKPARPTHDTDDSADKPRRKPQRPARPTRDTADSDDKPRRKPARPTRDADDSVDKPRRKPQRPARPTRDTADSDDKPRRKPARPTRDADDSVDKPRRKPQRPARPTRDTADSDDKPRRKPARPTRDADDSVDKPRRKPQRPARPTRDTADSDDKPRRKPARPTRDADNSVDKSRRKPGGSKRTPNTGRTGPKTPGKPRRPSGKGKPKG